MKRLAQTSPPGAQGLVRGKVMYLIAQVSCSKCYSSARVQSNSQKEESDKFYLEKIKEG